MKDLLMLDKFNKELFDYNQLSPEELPPEYPNIDTRFALGNASCGSLVIFTDSTCGVKNGFGWYLIPGETRALPLHKTQKIVAYILQDSWIHVC